jgi:hypothetical protein
MGHGAWGMGHGAWSMEKISHSQFVTANAHCPLPIAHQLTNINYPPYTISLRLAEPSSGTVLIAEWGARAVGRAGATCNFCTRRCKNWSCPARKPDTLLPRLRIANQTKPRSRVGITPAKELTSAECPF